jgi:hypothetical protein
MVKTKNSQMMLPLLGTRPPAPPVPKEQMEELLGALQELLVEFLEATTDEPEVSDDAFTKTDA